MFDPTHGTDIYRMKVCSFTTIDEHGHTVILAFALLASESEDMFSWAFKCFGDVFPLPPSAIFTDSDPGIARALALCPYFGKVPHLLCIFHLSKNFYTNLKKYFSNHTEWKG